MNWKHGVVLVTLGLVIGYWGSVASKDHQIVRLKAVADSIRVADSATTARALTFADSMEKIVAAKNLAEQSAKDQAAQASKSVAVFHDALHKAIADNTVALAALDSLEAAHAEEKQQLQNAVVAADAKVAALTVENGALKSAVFDLNRSIVVLAGRVNALHAGSTPKWLKLSFEALKLGGVAYAGYRAGRASK